MCLIVLKVFPEKKTTTIILTWSQQYHFNLASAADNSEKLK